MAVVVAFVSRKGGVGKSTLARGLAALAARKGLSTAIADLDTQQHTAMYWQRLREKHGIFPTVPVVAYPNIDAAIANESDVDLLIVDAPANDRAITSEVASVAHVTVQPSGASFDDLQPATELFYELSDSGLPRARLYIALSRLLEPDEERAAQAYLDVTGFERLPGAIVECAYYREAHNRGLAFIESPAEPVGGPATVLLESLLGKVVVKRRTLQPVLASYAPPAQPTFPAH